MQPESKKSRRSSPWTSRGGLSTKIHTAVDALGNPLRCLLSGGQVSDVTHAQALIEGIEADAVLAYKGYCDLAQRKGAGNTG